MAEVSDMVMQNQGLRSVNPAAGIGQPTDEVALHRSANMVTVTRVVVNGTMLARKSARTFQADAEENPTQDRTGLPEDVKELTHLHHPNIVRFYDLQFLPPQYHIYMEFVDGRTVKQLLHDLPDGCGFPPQTVKKYSRMLCDAINYLHTRERPIVHRNVNGSNVMIDRCDSVKLIDFGISRQVMGGSQHASRLYTQSHAGEDRFMAPELVTMDRRVYSAKSDVWAFGCTLFQMRTGNEPFAEVRRSADLANKIKEGAPPLPKTCCDMVQQFYNRCVVVARESRPTATQLLRHPYLQ